MIKWCWSCSVYTLHSLCSGYITPWLEYWSNTVFNLTRTRGSSHGGTSQSGGAQQRRVTTLPSVRGVGSRTKEVSGAHSRNSSRRSKNDSMTAWNGESQLTDFSMWDSELPVSGCFFLTGAAMRRKRREVRKHQKTNTTANMKHRAKIPSWHMWK